MPAAKKAARPESPKSPAGFRMPAEWEPHAATWIAWPHKAGDWPGKLAPIPWVYAEIVRLLHRTERVNILVRDAAKESVARRVLTKAGIDLDRTVGGLQSLLVLAEHRQGVARARQLVRV